MNKLILLIVISMAIGGCSTQTYIVNKGSSAEPTKEEMQAFFVYGLGQEVEINASGVCGGPEKVAKVESKLTFLDGFLGCITFGLYTPRTAKVYCII